MITLICFLVIKFLIDDKDLYYWLLLTGMMDGLIFWMMLTDFLLALAR